MLSKLGTNAMDQTRFDADRVRNIWKIDRKRPAHDYCMTIKQGGKTEYDHAPATYITHRTTCAGRLFNRARCQRSTANYAADSQLCAVFWKTGMEVD